MTAVVGGLCAALLWASSALSSSRSTRLLGALSVLAWIMTIGLVIDVVAIAATGATADVPRGAGTWGQLALAGSANVVGVLLFLTALRIGKVGLLAAIASAEGAVAATLSVLGGEVLQPLAFGALLVIVTGVLLSTFAPERAPIPGERPVLAAALAVLTALLNGFSIFLTGHLSSSIPIVWAVLPPRLVGVVVVAVPLALTRRLRISRTALPYVLVAGAGEIVGFWCFAWAAQQSVAIASVLASMFAAVVAVLAYVLFGERLTRHQVLGVVVVLSGVGALTAIVG